MTRRVSQTGVTLVELVIGLGVAMIVSLGVALILKHSRQVAIKQETAHGWELTRAQITRLMHSRSTCNGAFRIYSKGPPLVNVPARFTQASPGTSPYVGAATPTLIAGGAGKGKLVKINDVVGRNANGQPITVNQMTMTRYGTFSTDIWTSAPVPPAVSGPPLYRWNAVLNVQTVEAGKPPADNFFSLAVITTTAPPALSPIASCTGGQVLTEQEVCTQIRGGVYDVPTKTCLLGMETFSGADPVAPAIGRIWLRTDIP